MQNNTEKIRIIWIVNDRYVNNFITVYKECQISDQFEIFVIASPHMAYEFAAGYTADEIFEYLSREGIECIHSWDPVNQAYIDIERFEPDYIFTTTPYDIYLPDPYRSSRLMKIAKLCNIDYGAVISKRTGMYADAGENIYHVNCWMKFTTEDIASRSLYENYRPVGNLKLDEYLYYGRNPSADKKWHACNDGTRMLRIIWKPRWTIIQSDSNLIPYLESFHHYIRDNQMIDFVFLAHPFLITNVSNNEHRTIIENNLRAMNELPNFRIEDGSDFLDTVLSADVLIADHSSTLVEYAVTGKPIIYTSTDIELNELGQLILDVSYQASNFQDIMDVIEKLIDGIDPLKSSRELQKHKYFFSPPNGLSVAQYLLRILYEDYLDLNSRKQYAQRLYRTNRDELLRVESERDAVKRSVIDLEAQKADYELQIHHLKEAQLDLQKKYDALLVTNQEMIEKHLYHDPRIEAIVQTNRDLVLQNESLRASVVEIVNSTSWRLTRPLRFVGNGVRKLFGRIMK